MSYIDSSSKKLLVLISRKQKLKLIFLFFLIIICALLESIGIGALFPAISTLVDPNFNPEDLTYVKLLTEKFSSIKRDNLLIIFLTFFSIIFILSLVSRLLLAKLQIFLSFQIGADLSTHIFKNILSQSYEEHINQSSSLLISNLALKVDTIVHSFIYPIIRILGSSVIIIFIVATLNSIVSSNLIFIILSMFIIYSIIFFTLKKKLTELGIIINEYKDKKVKFIQESFYSYRDIIFSSLQKKTAFEFNEIEKKFKNSEANITFLKVSPRFVVELLGFVIIIFFLIISFYIQPKENFTNQIPQVAILAFTFQRIMPLAQQLYQASVSIKSGKANVISALNYLPSKNIKIQNLQQTPDNNEFLRKKMNFLDVSFRYDNSLNNVLENISIEINKGENIGLLGKSGSGKSTFLDLLSLLLKPTTGDITIDNKTIKNQEFRKNMQNIISYVPQNIFLINDTIYKNLNFFSDDHIFSEKKLNDTLEVCKLCDIFDFINNLPLKIETIVGENGIKFSGGQKQRIGLARGLNKEHEILILDEATNALDIETEKKILNNIFSNYKNKTKIIVSHREESLKYCDKIFKIENKKLITL